MAIPETAPIRTADEVILRLKGDRMETPFVGFPGTGAWPSPGALLTLTAPSVSHSVKNSDLFLWILWDREICAGYVPFTHMKVRLSHSRGFQPDAPEPAAWACRPAPAGPGPTP